MSSDCEDALRELYGYLDGQLTDEKRSRIKQHLDDCMPCLEVFDFEFELRQVIAKKCREQVPDALRRRIAESLGLPAEAAPTASASPEAASPETAPPAPSA